jgi:hypothetical protein
MPPPKKYSPVTPIYDCVQYDGKNFQEIVDWGAPLTKAGEKVYLGAIEVAATDWVMKDLYARFASISDQAFQIGYRPGGGP